MDEYTYVAAWMPTWLNENEHTTARLMDEEPQQAVFDTAEEALAYFSKRGWFPIMIERVARAPKAGS